MRPCSCAWSRTVAGEDRLAVGALEAHVLEQQPEPVADLAAEHELVVGAVGHRAAGSRAAR